MRNVSVLSAFCLFVLVGCTPPPQPTPEELKQICFDGGSLSALTYCVAAKPTVEQAKTIKIAVDQVRVVCNNYPVGGFVAAAYPLAKAEIDKVLAGDEKKAERLLAEQLCLNLMQSLDNLFNKHPDWKTNANLVATYAGAFCDGASDALNKYITPNKNGHPVPTQ